ncbi:MAG: hypothetical protein ACFFAH_13645, partial [Promethearchaeota archaeon]
FEKVDEQMEAFIKDHPPQKSLTESIRKLTENNDFYKKYIRIMKEEAKKFSCYDKKETATQKIVNLFLELIKNN